MSTIENLIGFIVFGCVVVCSLLYGFKRTIVVYFGSLFITIGILMTLGNEDPSMLGYVPATALAIFILSTTNNRKLEKQAKHEAYMKTDAYKYERLSQLSKEIKELETKLKEQKETLEFVPVIGKIMKDDYLTKDNAAFNASRAVEEEYYKMQIGKKNYFDSTCDNYYRKALKRHQAESKLMGMNMMATSMLNDIAELENKINSKKSEFESIKRELI